MKLFFGTYSYTIKHFKHEQVAVDGLDKRNLEFRLKMKVSHFMFIPFMGLEKYWVIKDMESGEMLDEVDERLKRKLDLLRYETKSLKVLLAYSGVMIPIVIVALFFGSFLFKEIGNKANLVFEDRAYISAKKNEVEGLEKGDVIYLKVLFLKKNDRDIRKKLMVEDKHQLALRVEDILEEEYLLKYLAVKQSKSDRLRQLEEQLKNKGLMLKVSKEKILRSVEHASPSNKKDNGIGLTRRVSGVEIKPISEKAIFYFIRIVKKESLF